MRPGGSRAPGSPPSPAPHTSLLLPSGYGYNPYPDDGGSVPGDAGVDRSGDREEAAAVAAGRLVSVDRDQAVAVHPAGLVGVAQPHQRRDPLRLAVAGLDDLAAAHPAVAGGRAPHVGTPAMPALVQLLGEGGAHVVSHGLCRRSQRAPNHLFGVNASLTIRCQRSPRSWQSWTYCSSCRARGSIFLRAGWRLSSTRTPAVISSPVG